MDIGPKDVEKHNAVLSRRDIPGRDGKQFVSQDGLVATVRDLLDDVQRNMLQQATEFRDENIHDVKTYNDLRGVIEAGGWARGGWAGSDEDEMRVKDETGATIRCFTFEQRDDKGECLLTGAKAAQVALFARAY
jgi:prolyl-tRNA synthetase